MSFPPTFSVFQGKQLTHSWSFPPSPFRSTSLLATSRPQPLFFPLLHPSRSLHRWGFPAFPAIPTMRATPFTNNLFLEDPRWFSENSPGIHTPNLGHPICFSITFLLYFSGREVRMINSCIFTPHIHPRFVQSLEIEMFWSPLPGSRTPIPQLPF